MKKSDMGLRLTGLVAMGTLMVDQGLKALLKDADQMLLSGVVKLLGIKNPGISFGFLAGHPEIVSLMTLALILLAALFLRWFPLSAVGAIGAGFLLGGALGNLLDRVIHGAVVDYVKLLFIDFPVFNLADACILLGAGLLVMEALAGPEAKRHE